MTWRLDFDTTSAAAEGYREARERFGTANVVMHEPFVVDIHADRAPGAFPGLSRLRIVSATGRTREVIHA